MLALSLYSRTAACCSSFLSFSHLLLTTICSYAYFDTSLISFKLIFINLSFLLVLFIVLRNMYIVQFFLILPSSFSLVSFVHFYPPSSSSSSPPPLLPPQIPEYCQRLDEQDVLDNAFDLIFAFDEIIALGYRENVNLAQI